MKNWSKSGRVFNYVTSREFPFNSPTQFPSPFPFDQYDTTELTPSSFWALTSRIGGSTAKISEDRQLMRGICSGKMLCSLQKLLSGSPEVQKSRNVVDVWMVDRKGLFLALLPWGIPTVRTTTGHACCLLLKGHGEELAMYQSKSTVHVHISRQILTWDSSPQRQITWALRTAKPGFRRSKSWNPCLSGG